MCQVKQMNKSKAYFISETVEAYFCNTFKDSLHAFLMHQFTENDYW